MIVVAVIQAKAGKQVELETLLKEVVAPTHQEPGCVLYALHRCVDNPCTFIFVEKWRSEKDLAQHLNSSHIQKGFAREKELMERVDVFRLAPVTVHPGPKESF